MTDGFYTKDGFQYFRKTNRIQDILDDRLVIENNKIAESVEYVNQKGIRTITINPFISRVQNLEFLKQIPGIEGLYLLQDDLELSPVNYLSLLKVFHVDKVNDAVDFRNLKNLQVFGATIGKTLGYLGECAKLFWLWLDNYKFDNLDNLSTLENLRHLNLYKTGIRDLSGIETLNKLVELNLESASKLTSLQGLSSTNESLKQININNAKNLVQYSALKNLANIEKIHFNKTGQCESFDFVSSLHTIRIFIHNGKSIVDK